VIKVLRVAWQEYRQHVFNKRFLLGMLSVPLLILVMVLLVFIIVSMENDTKAIGYVDHSGLLADPLPAPLPEEPEKPVALLPFDTEALAGAALDAGEIQGYYILPSDYLSTGMLSVVYLEPVKSPARRQFYDLLTVNLLRQVEPAVANRLTEGAEVIIVTPDGSRVASEEDFFSSFLPMILGLGFMLILFSTGGYLLQAVVDEKENRTMEVVITSVSPNQFMAGKIIGDLSIGLTQILLWGVLIGAIVLAARDAVEFLQTVRISTQTWLLLGLILFPTFVMVSGLMAMVGSTVAETREANQVIGFIVMPVWIPYFLIALILENPNSPIAIILSLMPMTAPLTMLMRDGLTVLPAWQIGLSAAIQVLCAVGAIWLAGRAFRLGMLRYGQRLRWREIFTRQKVGI
jgi:ABC-2 type transport system permease protein